MAPILKQLAASPKRFSTKICVTGQHRHLLDQVLTFFRIRPDYDLRVMRPSQSLTHTTVSILEGLEPLMRRERPDWVLVQGDTTTAMAGSLAAFYHSVRVAHVEAGLRTGDKYQPFPEEINRRIADVIADLYCAPTQTAKRNLILEGVSPRKILVTGNTVIDALLETARQTYDPAKGLLKNVPFHKKIILVTAHRRENFGKPLKNICKALLHISTFQDVRIVYPVHRNPDVWNPVHSYLDGRINIQLLPPLDYQAFIYLMKNSHLILTDSGGLQEEAPSLKKPVLVLREVTERPEAVATGTVKVIGTDSRRIVHETKRLLTDQKLYVRMTSAKNPYGDGKASRRIVEALANYPKPG